MSSESVLVERAGHVETWTLNVPESRNAISDPAVVEALCARVEAVNADHEVRAVVLTGAGSVFSAGGNVKDMVERRGMFGGGPYQGRERSEGRRGRSGWRTGWGRAEEPSCGHGGRDP